MARRPWYKRYPADFIAGTMMLTCEEKGAYNTVLDLIYDRGGPIPEDAQWLGRVAGCSTRRWKQLQKRLVEEGKIEVENGQIDNARARELRFISEKEREKLAENGAKGAEKTNKKRAENKKTNGLDEKGPLFSERHTRSQKPDTRDSSSQTPSPKTNSVSNETGAGAPGIRQRLFGPFLDWLAEQTGKPKDQYRSLVGRWLKQYGEGTVLEVCIAASREQPLDPVAWITKALRARAPSYMADETRPSEREWEVIRYVRSEIMPRDGDPPPDAEIQQVRKKWPEEVSKQLQAVS